MVSGRRIRHPIAMLPVTANIIIGLIDTSMNRLSRIGVNVEDSEPKEEIRPKLSPLTLAGNISQI